MTETINGFILKIADYRDNDILMSVLTYKYGVLSLISKSAKKVSAKLHYQENSLYEFIIDYSENKTMFSVINSKVIKHYIKYDDVLLNSFTNILNEIIYKSKEFIDANTYNNLLFYYDNLNEHNYLLLGSLFISYMARLHGITPFVDACVVCGSQKVSNIDNKLGGFVCAKHDKENNYHSIDELKKFRLLVKSGFDKYDSIKDYDISLNDFIILCDFFIYNADINIRSYDFYLKVIK